MGTLFLKCGKINPLLVVIKTSTKRVFGVFVTCSFERIEDPNEAATTKKAVTKSITRAIVNQTEQKKKQNFRGTGESFMFSLSPNVKRYGWTKQDNFFVHVGSKYITFGSGGLWTNESHGYSTTTPTFDNDQLSDEREFEVQHMEVFGLQ